MKNIHDEVKLVLEKYHNIGVMVSGGLDSTLLAYLLLTYRTDNVIRLFVVPRPDDSHNHALRIGEYLNKTFNVELELNVVGNGDVHHSKQVTSGLKEAIENYNCDIFLTSVTKNPESLQPPEMLHNYNYGGFIPKRVKSWHNKVYDVFWNYTKECTVAVIKELQLNEIVELSHTCTTSKTVRCGRCWQCCERQWAFNKNDYEDKGTM